MYGKTHNPTVVQGGEGVVGKPPSPTPNDILKKYDILKFFYLEKIVCYALYKMRVILSVTYSNSAVWPVTMIIQYGRFFLMFYFFFLL